MEASVARARIEACRSARYSWHIPRAGIPSSYPPDPTGFILGSARWRRGFHERRSRRRSEAQWIRGRLVKRVDRGTRLNFDNHRFDRTIERTNELSRDLFSRLVSSSVSWTIFDSFHRIGLNLLGFKVRFQDLFFVFWQREMVYGDYIILFRDFLILIFGKENLQKEKFDKSCFEIFFLKRLLEDVFTLH